MSNVDQRPIILTGDRPTGQLHLGHFVGSLRSRVGLQDSHHQHLLLADAQALTDNADNPDKVRRNILEVALDYLAVGIDPTKTTICVQSCLPALNELTMLYLNFVTVARLERNPTIKSEIQMRGFERDIPAGFLCYPVAQAADITAFKATVVPVGEDQIPMIEQTNEIVRRVNRQIGQDLLPECKALLSNMARLPGFDGKAKMSKSLGNTIVLNASDKDIKKAVNAMYTDPNHLRIEDPGQVEGNIVFTYLDAFDPNKEEVEELKAHYRRGGLGDGTVKKRLEGVLKELITPIRERREELAKDPDYIMDVLRQGTDKCRIITQQTLDEVKDGLGLFKF
ncbi:TPA: tryptophan--tRNA ligase [Acinetobacter baumannii]|jgi:tryptophanyl-tRNA synthetase|uniref:Tryptophan--tRNA ligase n=32 Tax=Acinetobacter calcoaceticus/baumannii complex TaxID=909768 RepID=A0ABX6CIZ4_ACIB2|nr:MULTISPECIES: tryptophan--tRNA ligase [Acinetobacter]ADX93593.1 tryptophanyl-tRNA synthetase II [Acinetobacter baumannii TCDC-AB0715]AHX28666.1 tryptophanyl-tRNA synthetase [Acinetobacter baumannii AC12]AHX66277.1 tryptophanyl-tRNA synthetase [Acinetobacter baumannii AC30]EMT88676.1 tryptophanyl-tRNA ligase II [Acinetobacter baumannii ABNIH5]EMT93277.1 tryptophanyl-tRNA ligase II [Acinetobacter baumannii ABNIH6]ETY68659.1 tryptophanyl-tRNA synthetase [Acinetobacter baumannii MDR_MMC4]EXB0